MNGGAGWLTAILGLIVLFFAGQHMYEAGVTEEQSVQQESTAAPTVEKSPETAADGEWTPVSVSVPRKPDPEKDDAPASDETEDLFVPEQPQEQGEAERTYQPVVIQ